MKTIVLDIETITEPRWTEKLFPPLPLHVPVVISYLVVETKAAEEIQVNAEFKLTSVVVTPSKEPSILLDLGSQLKGAQRLVTFNGRGFDMPLLNIRAMRYGLDWKWWNKRRYRYQRGDQPMYHYDLLDLIGDFGANRSISLDYVCKAVGLPGKTGGKGAEVQDMWDRGEVEQTVTYCEHDVILTWALYLKYMLSLDVPEYLTLRFAWDATRTFLTTRKNILFQLPESMV